ncbi:MAG: methylated-DNA--[protein]-cysteine S-methyltransferase [Firmicutes bacterium]|nr:methylated-DNA--[protein]-cysteine S-methyltransferase [Bacillota bacterium]
MKQKQCMIRCPIGEFIVSLSPSGVKEISFGLMNPRPDREPGFIVVGREGLDSRERAHLDRLTAELARYLNGERVDFEVEMELTGCTDFQRRVYETARSIPSGETRSYAWVAERCGIPRGSRAVGQALKRNPIVILIPCHRVIASDGGIGGFNGGLKWKRQLLDWERKP